MRYDEMFSLAECYAISQNHYSLLLIASLRAIQCNPHHQTAAASTASPQTAASSCHVQFAQPYIQLQVILTYPNAIAIYIAMCYDLLCRHNSEPEM